MAIQLSLLTFFAGTAMGLFKKVGILENIENDSTKTATLTIVRAIPFDGLVIALLSFQQIVFIRML
jgi:ABC-type methionine transport system permease subunit